MAMTPDAGGPGAESMSAEQRDLDVAAQALRDHTDERWVEIADSMLAGVLAKAPPSHPVQGQVGSETFYVSEQVLTSYLLDAIDPIPDVEVDAIDCGDLVERAAKRLGADRRAGGSRTDVRESTRRIQARQGRTRRLLSVQLRRVQHLVVE